MNKANSHTKLVYVPPISMGICIHECVCISACYMSTWKLIETLRQKLYKHLVYI